VYGDKSHEVVPSIYNLVALYDAQDRYDKVVALLKQVVDIVEKKALTHQDQETPAHEP
jgi:hypothetical protein